MLDGKYRKARDIDNDNNILNWHTWMMLTLSDLEYSLRGIYQPAAPGS
jgi:hypothetical protein